MCPSAEWGDNISAYLIVQLWGFNELTQLKHLEQSLVRERHYSQVSSQGQGLWLSHLGSRCLTHRRSLLNNSVHQTGHQHPGKERNDTDKNKAKLGMMMNFGLGHAEFQGVEGH